MPTSSRPSPAELLDTLEELPRTPLARLPTPLAAAPQLGSSLGRKGPLYLKLDSESGFALGGNKVRKLEHELAPPRLDGVTHLVTAGSLQSNHARVTAAAAARLGLRCILVLNGKPAEPPRGNALLQRLFGADVVAVGDRREREAVMWEAARKVEADGGRPLVIPLGASTPTGALGYVRAAVELDAQLRAVLPGAGVDEPAWVFVPSSSCGTLAGLVAGFTLLERPAVRLVGVSADIAKDDLLGETRRIALGALRLLGEGSPRIPDGLVEASDEEVGEGYGLPTETSREALLLFARSEGVVLDPVYTAKAAAALVGWTLDGRVPRRDALVFLHTGGHPALFA